MEAGLVMSKTLDQIRTRFFEITEFGESLDPDEKERLLKRWEEELADFSNLLLISSANQRAQV